MKLVGRSSPFGGETRTRVLLALALLGESYPRELSRLLGKPLNGIQQAIRSLEKDGLIGGRSMGRTRLFRLEPRYFAARELEAYLKRLADPDDDLRDRVATLRRRPRRTGKPLTL
ncbi:MAG TPA: winged helix-turn-helix domain-containing protein [Thermoanaerobaculia bacterium]|jgi:DNA-binding transcriptional ArsR family regulator